MTNSLTHTKGETGNLPRSLHFHLFGEFVAWWEGEQLPPMPYRTRGLLAAIVLEPHIWQRIQLVGWLFPDVPERKGRQWLSHTLWQLRRWLPQLPVEATRETLHIPPESRWLDVEAFRRAAGGKELESWLEALALYRGDLLEGLYDDWLLEEREALYLHYVALAHRTCDALWQRGQFEALLPHAERLVQREPYDERALRTLMKAYRALGRRGAALAAYERCLSLLHDEMGIAPEPATQTLARAIRTTSPAASVTAPFLLKADTSPELLRHAREALIRGDVARVRAALEVLRERSEACTEERRLLEIDLALFLEDYERAAALLADEGWGQRLLALQKQLRLAHLALKRHEVTTAEDVASEVLVAAREVEDREMELGALLVLVAAQQRLGQGVHAERSAERALALARESGLHYGIARVLILQGKSQIHQGRYKQARTCFYEARSVALEHGLRYDLACALRGLRVVAAYTDAFEEALETAQEELGLWRDLGLDHWEAVTMEGISMIECGLGRSADSLRTLVHAEEVSRRLNDPVRLAINRYNLASAMIYHDDGLAPEAQGVARQALVTFRAFHQLQWEATTLTILGYVLWVDGRHAAANDHLHQAHALSEQLGELTFVPELLAYQGLAHLGLERPAEALAFTRRAVTSMAQGDVSAEVVPEICYAHALALAANNREEQAEDYFRRAYDSLLEGAAALSDEEARQAFFHRNPTTRRLMRELRDRAIAPPSEAGLRSVRLPAVRGGEPLRVHWTVDAGPADAALKRAQGAIALRRARLARLLQEAQMQGAAPSTADLAHVLGVSRRTIQRDLEAFRKQ